MSAPHLSAMLFAASILSAPALAQTPQAPATPSIVCAYDANSGVPNPLGMRSFIELQEFDGTTTVSFLQFPSPVSGASGVEAIIGSERILTFIDTDIETARQLLLTYPDYYNTLLGIEDPALQDPEGFAPVNAVLACQAAPAAPVAQTPPSELGTPDRPAPVQPIDTIATLPDGNYRYWSAQSDFRVVSDAELLAQGGALFLFKKTGSQIVGTFGYIDGEAVCISGRVSGNTVSGAAVNDNPGNPNLGEDFVAFGPGNFLNVRRSRRSGNLTIYRSAILDVNGFSRINAGTRLPPDRCPF